MVFTYNDSRKDFHKLCQIPRNCRYKWLLVSSSAPGTSSGSHDCSSTSSARIPCYFRLQADVTIWVLRKVCIYTVLTRTRFHIMTWLGRVLTSLLWVSPRLCWSTSINQILSEFLWPSRQFMRYISLFFFAFLILIKVFGFCGFMQRVSRKTFTRTSTSFWYWIFGVSVGIKNRILWWRWWRSRWRCTWERTRW